MGLWPGPERLKAVEAPRSDVGAPLPLIMADDYRFAFAYRLHVPDPAWDGTYIEIVGDDDESRCAVVIADEYFAVQLGPPNDEAMRGHRLFLLGLRAYSAFEVENSSWIEAMETANRVHRNHDPERFKRRRHFIFTFHDSTLEFVACGFSCTTGTGRIRQLLTDAFATLQG